jgi:hypothetical protein
VTDLLDRLGATGWTVLPVLSGRGRQGIRRAGDPGGVDDNVVVVCIASAELAARVGCANAARWAVRNSEPFSKLIPSLFPENISDLSTFVLMVFQKFKISPNLYTVNLTVQH